MKLQKNNDEFRTHGVGSLTRRALHMFVVIASIIALIGATIGCEGSNPSTDNSNPFIADTETPAPGPSNPDAGNPDAGNSSDTTRPQPPGSWERLFEANHGPTGFIDVGGESTDLFGGAQRVDAWVDKKESDGDVLTIVELLGFSDETEARDLFAEVVDNLLKENPAFAINDNDDLFVFRYDTVDKPYQLLVAQSERVVVMIAVIGDGLTADELITYGRTLMANLPQMSVGNSSPAPSGVSTGSVGGYGKVSAPLSGGGAISGCYNAKLTLVKLEMGNDDGDAGFLFIDNTGDGQFTIVTNTESEPDQSADTKNVCGPPQPAKVTKNHEDPQVLKALEEELKHLQESGGNKSKRLFIEKQIRWLKKNGELNMTENMETTLNLEIFDYKNIYPKPTTDLNALFWDNDKGGFLWYVIKVGKGLLKVVDFVELVAPGTTAKYEPVKTTVKEAVEAVDGQNTIKVDGKNFDAWGDLWAACVKTLVWPAFIDDDFTCEGKDFKAVFHQKGITNPGVSDPEPDPEPESEKDDGGTVVPPKDDEPGDEPVDEPGDELGDELGDCSEYEDVNEDVCREILNNETGHTTVVDVQTVVKCIAALRAGCLPEDIVEVGQCGNGKVEGSEECDTSDQGCRHVSYWNGTSQQYRCNAQCRCVPPGPPGFEKPFNPHK